MRWICGIVRLSIGNAVGIKRRPSYRKDVGGTELLRSVDWNLSIGEYRKQTVKAPSLEKEKKGVKKTRDFKCRVKVSNP